MAEAVLFYMVAAMVVGCALGCVLASNIVRMAAFLFGTLGAVAILYFLMGATFLGSIQLIVYAGGTLIVIIFGVMLTSQAVAARFVPRRVEVIAGAVVCLALFGGLVVAVLDQEWAVAEPGLFAVAEFGEALLTTYLVPFELAAVLLLAVMIGSAYLARAEKH